MKSTTALFVVGDDVVLPDDWEEEDETPVSGDE